MSLTRTIPIKDHIFSSEALAGVLKELSSYYRKSKDDYFTNRYLLQISEDEHTTTSIDSPPKSFDPLFTTPIRYLSLRISQYSPNRDIEFTLYHGSDSIHNSLRLHSDDEDWVNLAHAKASKLLDSIEPQSGFLRRYGTWLFFPFALIVGWPLKNLFFLVLRWFGQTKQVPWSYAAFSNHLIFAFILGGLPAMWLLAYAAKAYPSIEIQTGPNRGWKEARLRSKLRLVLAVAIVGPLANFLYDIYKAIFAA